MDNKGLSIKDMISCQKKLKTQAPSVKILIFSTNVLRIPAQITKKTLDAALLGSSIHYHHLKCVSEKKYVGNWPLLRGLW